MKLSEIKPQTAIEQEILTDLLKCHEDGVSVTMLTEDIKDAPDDYTYSLDDLEQFIFAYQPEL